MGVGRHPGPALRPDLPALPLSFYQVNRDQAERLYEKAAEYAALTGDEVLLDLYCGTGTIGLSMANRAKKLLGVEIIPQAVENAKENAARNHIHNAGFLCGDAAQAAAELERSGERPHVVVIDPPRKAAARTWCGPSPHGPPPGGIRLLRPSHPGPGPEALRPAGLPPGRRHPGGHVPRHRPRGDRGAAGASEKEASYVSDL